MTRTMKDSGIEWIGEIPEDWATVPIGHLYSERKQKVSDTIYKPLSVTKQGIVPQLDSAAKSDAHDDRKLVCVGDFAINSRSDRRGSCGISDYEGSISLINTVLKPKTKIIPKYFDWLFHTTMFADEFYKWGHGIVADLWTTNWSDMKKIMVTLPSMPEQQKIADFLDKKCSHIDSILEKTKASIDECKQLKQSVITQAVTKGIRPNRPMKDSGIEWIGQIPEDWKIKKLKYSCSNRNENYSSDYGVLEYFALENIESKSAKFIHTENVYDITQSQICKENDVVFGKLRPYLAKVYQVPALCCCSGEFAVFCDFEGVADYYKYIMLSHWFINIVDASTYGTKMPRANIQFIKNMDITVPSKTEQIEIVSYLDEKCTEIDKLITKKEKLIAELETYKKSLIYEYVTGKKEVI